MKTEQSGDGFLSSSSSGFPCCIADLDEVAVVRCNGTYDGRFVFVGMMKHDRIFVIYGNNKGEGASFPSCHYNGTATVVYSSLCTLRALLKNSPRNELESILTAILNTETLDLDYWPLGIDARVNLSYFPHWIGPNERTSSHSWPGPCNKNMIAGTNVSPSGGHGWRLAIDRICHKRQGERE